MKILQKRVAKKVKGSKNRNKARQHLSKIHEKISNQRNNFQHQVSSKLISKNQAIALETLNVKGMVRNHHLAQAIGDSAWSNFVIKLEYKAQWFGKTVLRIGQFEPSSKLCSVCGYHNKELQLKEREWTCPDCKTKHDRDINAAINIKKFALIDQNLIVI
jgi:putative transposase